MTSQKQPPRPKRPASLPARGRGARLWKATCDRYELRQDELDVLEEVCRHLDLCDKYAKLIEKAPLVVEGSKGQDAPHPLLQELRASRLLVSQLLRSLRLPDSDEDQRDRDLASASARRAAMARWS